MKRCDIRDTAAYFNEKHFMGRLETNIDTIEGYSGTFSEHPTELAGTILERN